MSHLHLILGGSRSGKSSYAEQIAKEQNKEVIYVATCRTEGLDSEMQNRIGRHKNDRPDHWKTIENRFDLVATVAEYNNHCILLDCLTLWLGNEMDSKSEEEIYTSLEAFMKTHSQSNTDILVVSNEVGMGLVPENPVGREFRDIAGRANQMMAVYADKVTFMVAGIPWQIKPAQ